MFHGCGNLSAKELMFPAVQRGPAYTQLLCNCLCAGLPSAKLKDCRLPLLWRVLYAARFAENVDPRFGVQLINPGREGLPAWIPKCFHCSSKAAIMVQVVLDRNSFLLVGILLR